MSEEQIQGEEPLMKMEEEDEEELLGAEEGGPGEAEGSKIDASKNEEDEGWVSADKQEIIRFPCTNVS